MRRLAGAGPGPGRSVHRVDIRGPRGAVSHDEVGFGRRRRAVGPPLRLWAEKPHGHGDPWSLEKLDEHRREGKAGTRVAVEDVERKG